MTRISKPGGGFSYGYGYTQPLPIASVVASLKGQLAAIRNVLTAFDALAQEHVTAIKRELAQ